MKKTMKKVIYIVILLLFTSCLSFLSQKKDGRQQESGNMEQREKTTELNYFENPRYANKPREFVAEDGNYICRYSSSVCEYTPPETFYMIQKRYYENGELESKISFILDFSLYVEKYDKDGFLIEKTDRKSIIEERKLDGMDYASFLEKEGWYDRSTGQTAFREEPYPLNTGEFTEMVMRCISYTSNRSTRYIRITNIKKIPQQFLDKYGTIGEDGVKYLERRNSHSKWAKLDVVYIIDSETGTYKVNWAYLLHKE